MAHDIALTVNGRRTSVAAEAVTPLLDVLRNRLDLKGTRYGCGLEQCGSCMVLLDGEPIYACSREIGTVAGRSITTIEGLGTAVQPHPLQQAFLDEGAMQCAYCTSGMIMTAVSLLNARRDSSAAEIARSMEGNICRCGTQPRIVLAIQRAAKAMDESKQ